MLAYSSRLKPFVILLGDVDSKEVKKDPTEHTPTVRALKKKAKKVDKD
jgi:hypothetical protein